MIPRCLLLLVSPLLFLLGVAFGLLAAKLALQPLLSSYLASLPSLRRSLALGARTIAAGISAAIIAVIAATTLTAADVGAFRRLQ